MTVHALGEVRTREPIGFESESASLSEGARGLLEHVASLLNGDAKHRSLRLCVEGHTDGQGTTSANAKLSLERAKAVSEHLESLGVDMSRLSPHGFGAAFPVDSNETDSGRAANRRVELLVIPSCFAQAEKMMGTKEAASSLSNHASNRPGVAKYVS